jgi:hypothetical protein
MVLVDLSLKLDKFLLNPTFQNSSIPTFQMDNAKQTGLSNYSYELIP